MKGFPVDLQFGNLWLRFAECVGWKGSYWETLYVIQVRNEQGRDEAPW